MATINIGDLISGGAGLGTAYALYDVGQGLVDYLKSQDPQSELARVGEEALSGLDFTPYSVTTGFGGGRIDPSTGQYTTTLTPEQQELQTSLISQATQLAGTAGPTADELYAMTQEARQPGVDRARLALENRLAAQGRLGTETAAYGGTPEAFAMEQAIAEQQSKDILGTQTLAGQLEQQRLSNIGGLLGAAFKPEETVLSSMLGLAPLSQQKSTIDLGTAQILRDLGVKGVEAEAALGASAAGLEAANIEAVAKIINQLLQSESLSGLTELKITV